MAGSGNRQPDLEKLVAESVAKALPAALQGVLASLSLPGQNEPQAAQAQYQRTVEL